MGVKLARCSYAVTRAPLLPLWRVVLRAQLRDTIQQEEGFFHLFYERDDGADAAEAFMKVGTALALIAQADPRRYRRIAADMPRIFVRRGGGSAYWSLVDTCVLEDRHVRQDPRANVALTIVHEAAHARLYRRGIRYWPDLVERIEHRCIMEQILFTRRLKRMGWEVDGMTKYLEARLDRQYLDPRSIHQWRLRALHARNVPRGVIWVLSKLMEAWNALFWKK
jgi:hypothetical protein